MNRYRWQKNSYIFKIWRETEKKDFILGKSEFSAIPPKSVQYLGLKHLLPGLLTALQATVCGAPPLIPFNSLFSLTFGCRKSGK